VRGGSEGSVEQRRGPLHKNQIRGLGLVSDLIKLSILKPAAHARYRDEEVAAFLGE